jgi:hypothetical protein
MSSGSSQSTLRSPEKGSPSLTPPHITSSPSVFPFTPGTPDSSNGSPPFTLYTQQSSPKPKLQSPVLSPHPSPTSSSNSNVVPSSQSPELKDNASPDLEDIVNDTANQAKKRKLDALTVGEILEDYYMQLPPIEVDIFTWIPESLKVLPLSNESNDYEEEKENYKRKNSFRSNKK